MKHEIEIPDLPEGYRAVAYRLPAEGEQILSDEGVILADKFRIDEIWLIVEKIKPRRRVFECVSETPRKVLKGEFGEIGEGSILFSRHDGELCSHAKIWREVKEES